MRAVSGAEFLGRTNSAITAACAAAFVTRKSQLNCVLLLTYKIDFYSVSVSPMKHWDLLCERPREEEASPPMCASGA